MNINQQRLQNRIQTLSEIGKVGLTGVRRLAHSKKDFEAVDLLRTWMTDAGLETRIDDFGNLIGRLEGIDTTRPILMLGSHIDSQPYGGRFDGPVGTLGALEVVERFKENGIQPKMPVEVVSFSDEEGSRFNKGTFGSRGIVGKVDLEELDHKDKEGITRREALISFGCNPDNLEDSIYNPNSIKAFLEMHIEQGPLLENVNQPVGVVTGISGPLWLTVTLRGFAGHAGSVPMNLRKDALVGASEVITAFNEIVRRDPDVSTVGTVGHVQVFPDSRNIIPEEVTFTIDLRDINVDRRTKCETELYKIIDHTCNKYRLTYEVNEDFRKDPSYCAGWLKDIIKSRAADLELNPPELMSGPFHDALSLSEVCDFGMIFVRCKEGISHNPEEFATFEDISIGTELLYKTALQIIR